MDMMATPDGGDTACSTSQAPRPRAHAIAMPRAELVDALARDGLDPRHAPGFRTLCGFIGAYFHHEFYEKLTLLRELHAGLSAPDAGPQDLDERYARLEKSLVEVLQKANYEELDSSEIATLGGKHPMLDVHTRTPMHMYESARVFYRGPRREQKTHRGLLSSRTVTQDTLDDIVIWVRFRKQTRGRRFARPGLPGSARPGSLLIKSFRNVPRDELPMLLPGVEVIMSRKDAILLGGPALLGGIPVALNIAPALSVILVVAGALLGISGTVQHDQLMKAVGALSALVGAGAFMFRQYASYAFRKLRYQKRVADNVYFHNVNNDAGVLDTLIGAAEEQEIKEVLLAYHALLAKGPAGTTTELDQRIETWLQARFGLSIDFEVDDALEKLHRLGFLEHGQAQLSATTVDTALSRLDMLWDRLYDFSGRQSAAGA